MFTLRLRMYGQNEKKYPLHNIPFNGRCNLDELDLVITKLLTSNCRMSLQELSDKTGITRTAVKKRLDKLVESGSIVSYTVRLSAEMAGTDFAIAIIEFDSEPKEDEILTKLGNFPSIVQVNKTFDSRFVIFGEYKGADGLSDYSSLLWSLPNVKNVDLYPKFVGDRGGSIDLTGIHMKILTYLIEDARMSISDISAKSGLTLKRVSKTIDQMLESRAFLFTIRWRENVPGSTEVFTKVRWNVDNVNRDDLLQWLQDEFEGKFHVAYISATEPILFFAFIVQHFTDVEPIIDEMKKSGYIQKVEPILLYPGHKFPWLRDTILEDMLSNANI